MISLLGILCAFPCCDQTSIPHPKIQTNNHSKFSQSKNIRENHFLNYCTLSPKLHMQKRLGRAHHTSSSAKFHSVPSKKIYIKAIETCFTTRTAGFRKNSLFVSAQLIYFLPQAGDRLFYFPLLSMALQNSSAAGFVTTKTGVVYPQARNITLAEERTPVPCSSNTKIFSNSVCRPTLNTQNCSVSAMSNLQNCNWQ